MRVTELLPEFATHNYASVVAALAGLDKVQDSMRLFMAQAWAIAMAATGLLTLIPARHSNNAARLPNDSAKPDNLKWNRVSGPPPVFQQKPALRAT